MLDIVDPLFWWSLAGLSVIAFIGSLIAVPWVITHLPADYFTPRQTAQRARRARQLTHRELVHRVVRNCLGLLVLICGFAMLIMPGQGVLTILIAILLIDFPRKHRFQRWLACRPHVLRAMNWIRAKAHKPPLLANNSPTAAPAPSSLSQKAKPSDSKRTVEMQPD